VPTKRKASRNRGRVPSGSSWKQKVILTIATVVIAVIGLAIIAWKNSASKANPIIPQDTTILRPKHWMGKRMPTMVREKSVKEYEGFLSDLVTKVPLTPFQAVTLDSETVTRVLKAKSLIERVDHLEGSWKWQDVKRVVAAFGDSVPIVAPSGWVGEKTIFLMGYDELTDRLMVSPRIMDEDLEFVASVLVHEATHAVVSKAEEERTGLTADELTRIMAMCSDYAWIANFSGELLAFKNQARWFLSRDMAPVYIVKAGSLAAAIMFEANGSGMDAPHARWLEAYLEEYPEAPTFNGEPFRCSPVIVVRGPRRGQIYVPSDVAPELIVPVLDELPDW